MYLALFDTQLLLLLLFMRCSSVYRPHDTAPELGASAVVVVVVVVVVDQLLAKLKADGGVKLSLSNYREVGARRELVFAENGPVFHKLM